MRQSKLSFVNFADHKKEDLFAKTAVFHMKMYLEEKEAERRAKSRFKNFYENFLSVGFQLSMVFFLICFVADSLLVNMFVKNAYLAVPVGFLLAVIFYCGPRYLASRKQFKEITELNKETNGYRKQFLTALETSLIEKSADGLVAHPDGLDVLEPEAKFRMIDTDFDIHHLIVKRKIVETDSDISFSLMVVRDPDFEDSRTKNYSKIIFSAFSHVRKEEILELNEKQMFSTDSGDKEVVLNELQENNRVEKDFSKLVEGLDIDVDSIYKEFDDDPEFDYDEDDELYDWAEDDDFMDEDDDFFGVDDEEFMELTPDQEEQIAEFMQTRFPDKMMELQRQADEIRRTGSDKNYVKVSFSPDEIEELKAFISNLKGEDN